MLLAGAPLGNRPKLLTYRRPLGWNAMPWGPCNPVCGPEMVAIGVTSPFAPGGYTVMLSFPLLVT